MELPKIGNIPIRISHWLPEDADPKLVPVKPVIVTYDLEKQADGSYVATKAEE